MADQLLHHGQLSIYMWGQAYGGSLEAIVTAAAFAVFGSSVSTLVGTTALCSAIAALALWWAGRQLLGGRAPLYGALLLWLWPASFTFRSLKPGGTYMLGLALSLLALGLLARLKAGAGSVPLTLAAGITCGLSAWASPMSVQLLGPALLWALPSLLGNLRQLGRLLVGAATGAVPLLIYGWRNHWSNLRPPPLQPGLISGFFPRLEQFFHVEWPLAMSLRVEGSLRWVGGPLGPALAAVAYAVFLAAAAAAIAGRLPALRLPLLCLAALPLLYAVNTEANRVGQTRYVFFGATMAYLLVGAVIEAVGTHWRPQSAAPAGIVLFALLGFVALAEAPLSLVAFPSPDVPMPVSDSALRLLLREHHVRYAFASYWMAYRVTFETASTTTVTPFDLDRYQPMETAVSDSPAPAYLFVSRSATVGRFVHWCATAGVPIRNWSRSGFTLVEPESRVLPSQVPRSVLQ
jgi:hypothetical protein